MTPIVQLVLCVAGANFLMTAVLVARQKAPPGWSNLSVSHFAVGTILIAISEHNSADSGADLLRFFGGVAIGMGLMAVLMMIREARDYRDRAHGGWPR